MNSPQAAAVTAPESPVTAPDAPVAGPDAPVAATDAPVAAPGLPVTAPESRVKVEDNRRLSLALDDALEALLSLDRQIGGWLWRGTGHAVRLETDEAQALVVQARRTPGAEPETVRFERQHIGAAIIHYCHSLRIPMPRGARKEIELSADGVVLVLSMTIDGPRTRLASRA